MSLDTETTLRTVSGISESETQRIKDFLQGAIYCWCKNEKGSGFHCVT